MKSTFGDALARLKQRLGVTTDREVAGLLGLTDKAFNARKARGVFPEDKLYALATKRPELQIDPAYVLTGKPATARVAERLEAFPSRLIELRGEESVTEFAKRVGIPAEMLALLESGRALPTAEHVYKLAKAFPERSPAWLTGGPRPTLDEDLNDIEIVLVRNYRMCPPGVRERLRKDAAAGAMEAMP